MSVVTQIGALLELLLGTYLLAEASPSATYVSLLKLWSLTRLIHLCPEIEDSIILKLSASGEYMAALAYKAQFIGCSRVPPKVNIWKC